MPCPRARLLALAAALQLVAASAMAADLVRSARSGPWSSPGTWEAGAVPGGGARVQIRRGHVVLYDLASERPIRSIHVAGTLRFARDRDTRLDVGLIKIQAGDDASEDGFDCDLHLSADPAEDPTPTLEVGSFDHPIPAGRTATIRLNAVDGLDPTSTPAIVCCGGRMEFHGAPMSRTWVKLGADVRPGNDHITLSEAINGWRPGDHVLVTATRRERKEGATLRPGPGSIPAYSEERTVREVSSDRLILDRPLAFDHAGSGEFRGEVANLSRNVVVTSADPARARGHTMYHRGSSGSISYTEFRGLGKEGVKGRYPIHFHLVGDTMRGTSVLGASIVESGNRWITIHGTNDLIIRDCVGYRAVGHGFFFEDGTETLNVLDRNLAVQAFAGKPLPDQALAFDANAGAGFWWANSLNTLTRNVATECDRYGFRFEATPAPASALLLRVLGVDGVRRQADIRTLPFVRFEGNEAHAQLYGLNLGEGNGGVGPGRDQPFHLRETRIWDAFWAFRPEAPAVLVDGLAIERTRYGIFNATGDVHTYRRVTIRRTFMAGSGPAGTAGDAPDLVPHDDQPPRTVVTHVGESVGGKRLVQGTSSDNGSIRRVLVEGCEARPLEPDFSRWEAWIDEPVGRVVHAHAEDSAGNIERQPHTVRLDPTRPSEPVTSRPIGEH
jgi:G8 domain